MRFRRDQEQEGVYALIFCQREIDALRLLCWCRYASPDSLRRLITETEMHNLVTLGFIKEHPKSHALIPTCKTVDLLQGVFDGAVPEVVRVYSPPLIERRLRLSQIAVTFYRGGVTPFLLSREELLQPPALFLPSVARGRGQNPWGSTRIAGIAYLGEQTLAVHYVCPGIGRLILNNELVAFNNQTAALHHTRRGFLFAGESYSDILTELDQPTTEDGNQAVNYAGAYRRLALPVHLLPCDDTGALQLRVMTQPNYRSRLAQAALGRYYQPPPEDVPAFDACFNHTPVVIGVDMDLRRINAALETAKELGHPYIILAALTGQVRSGVFDNFRIPGQDNVLALREDVVLEFVGGSDVTFPNDQPFRSEKGGALHAPVIQTHRKAGR